MGRFWLATAERKAPWEDLLPVQKLLRPTWSLSAMLDRAFSDKVEPDTEALSQCIERGADVNSNSITFTQDSLLLVVLNSKHLDADTVYAIAKLLIVNGAVVGNAEKKAMLSWEDLAMHELLREAHGE